MKGYKNVTFRKPEFCASYEENGKPCECCGSIQPYGQKLKMTRCNIRSTYLNTSVYLCLECTAGKTHEEIEVLALKAMDTREIEMKNLLDN